MIITGRIFASLINFAVALLNIFLYTQTGNDVNLFIAGVNMGIAGMILFLPR